MRTEVTKENLGKLSHKDQVRFSLFCAKQIEHLIAAKEAKNCIKVTEQWLRDEASQEECREAANAAYDVAYTARAAVTYAYAAYAAFAANAAFAAHAAYTAANAAYTAVERGNKAKVTKEQEEYLYELININLIIEQNLLT